MGAAAVPPTGIGHPRAGDDRTARQRSARIGVVSPIGSLSTRTVGAAAVRAPIVLLVTLVTACGFLPSSPPDWVTNRSAMPSCGEEVLDRGVADDEDGWNCLLAALDDRRDAELVRNLTTTEGDPIVQIVRVHADGRIELMIDATRDSFGSGRWERLECDRLLQGGGWEGCLEVPAP